MTPARDQSDFHAEIAAVRARLREVDPGSWQVYAPPVLFFVAAIAIARLQDAGLIDPVVHWAAFGTMAVLSMVATLMIIARRTILRRGNRVIAPALILYLVAVRSAVSAREEYGVEGFVIVLLGTMVVLAAYSGYLRTTEKPSAGARFEDSRIDSELRPLVTALGYLDRVDRTVLAVISHQDEPDFEANLFELEKAGYVNLGTRAPDIDTVTPTTKLRESARKYLRNKV